MKSIAHFASAVAAATFVPGVVALAGEERGLILLMAGVFGLLPDWLDFNLGRQLEPADEAIQPNGAGFDAQAVADQLARAVHRAHAGDSLTVELRPAPLGPERWRRYLVRFDGEGQAVVVQSGPIIDGDGRPVGEAAGSGPAGRAEVGPALRCACEAETRVETLEGAAFEFRRAGEAIDVYLSPWRRRWSHSLVLAAVFGLTAAALFGSLCGWVVAVAYAAHIAGDQLGRLGSNLWWPFTPRRQAGLHLVRSGDSLPNAIVVLIACGLVLSNLNRFADPPPFAGGLFLLWAVLVPAAAGLISYAAGKRRPAAAALEAAERADHDEEIRGG